MRDVESVSAVSGTGRWLGSTLVKAGSNEIPAARELLGKLDLVPQTSCWPMRRTPRSPPSSRSFMTRAGDYALTVKENQRNLFETLATLLTPEQFSPSAHGPHPRPDPGKQPGPA